MAGTRHPPQEAGDKGGVAPEHQGSQLLLAALWPAVTSVSHPGPEGQWPAYPKHNAPAGGWLAPGEMLACCWIHLNGGGDPLTARKCEEGPQTLTPRAGGLTAGGPGGQGWAEPAPTRRYEVMQCCWLQPEQRPTAEEVHLLLSYLSAKGAAEPEEEEFEQRWRALRPRGGGAGEPGAGGLALGGAGELATASSFPLLEQFSGEGFHADSDDVLTVTETSCGLNFECKWEAGQGADAFSPPGDALSLGCPAPLQEPCAPEGAPPGVVPVLSAHSPSVGSEYFIRLEEPTPTAGHDPDCAGCAPSSKGPDSDGMAVEPPLGQTLSTDGPWGHSDHHPRRSPTQDPPCPSCSPSPGGLMQVEARVEDADWGAAALCPPILGDPLGASISGTSAPWLPNSKRGPESWVPGCTGGCTDGGHVDGCPVRKHGLQAVPELGHPLAPADPREPLHGPEEPGRCLDLSRLCPAEGLAPARGLVTYPWTEPRCAEEAEGPAGSQLSLPSIPTPSLEGALLPMEEASAPMALPASPTPASSQAAATEPAHTWDGGSSSLEVEAPGSEDEDTTEATSGIFTDFSSDSAQAEKLDSTPAIRSLQKQVGTPDSLDSLDIPSSASDGGCEACSSPAVGTPGGQPRALDSGYDTENYESPEFVLKEAQEPCEPEASGLEMQLPGSLSGLSEKNPYRDSAYFSDLDTEPDPPSGSEKGAGGVLAPGPEPDLGSPQGPGLQLAQPSEPWEPREAQSPGPREVLPLPLGEDSSPGPSACPTGPGQEAPWPQGPAQVPPVPGPGRSKVFLLTPVPRSSEGCRPELQEAPGLRPALQERTGGRGTPRAPLHLALEGLPAAPEGRLEEEDSEDSDESDEELRCYSVQEASEESEEEAPPVPVVVAESQSARRLRSLLKMPGLLPAFCEDLERKKKAVSFFDDVTVYLFDQVGGGRRLS